MSSSPTDAPPEGGDQNRGATVIAVFWVMCTIVVTTIVLRFYSRTKMQRLGSDDWMMLFTVVSPSTRRVPFNAYRGRFCSSFLPAL